MLDIPTSEGFHSEINCFFSDQINLKCSEEDAISAIKAEMQRLHDKMPNAQKYTVVGSFEFRLIAQDANEPL